KQNKSNHNNIINTYLLLQPTATDTTQRLGDLRSEMIKSDFQAYIIPSSDAHLSEYLAPSEKRRVWISGFTGSAGTAVVTLTKAAMWTDGRYFLQAEQELDCNWSLMKIGEQGVPTIEEWLVQELGPGMNVGGNPFLFSIELWLIYASNLASGGVALNQSIPDIVDNVWTDRPPLDGDEVVVLPVQYAGVEWTDKLLDVRKEMKSAAVDYLLLTVLDENAWFFNLRGSDIPYTPVFTSYTVIGMTDVVLFGNMSYFAKQEIKDHLAKQEIGCESNNTCATVQPYENARPYLQQLTTTQSNAIFWLPSDGTTYGMYSVVDEDHQISDISPLKIPKSVKNSKEIEAMRQAHIYDAVALCEYLQWLEINVPKGTVDELNGAEKVKNLRLAQPTSKGLSFGSISASGPNAAIIHYRSTPETNRPLTTTEVYMIDSGGQYFEGTTDVTRSVHFGTPTDFEKEAFTRVLMGQIDTQSAIFPYTKDGNYLDMLARRHLYDVGLEYRHGTGHGVGQYLCIHEYPPGIGNAVGGGYPLQPGMFTSVEPGFYQDGEFGIRIENVNVVVEAVTEHNFGGYKFYTFDPVTLAPIQLKMINVDLLSDKQIKYLNDYHKKVEVIVGEEALRQNKPELKDWIQKATVPLARGTSTRNNISWSIMIFIAAVCTMVNVSLE
uniref:Uncharacterized protein n=1 Tax=Ciona intestinalis TaxID=7719 RepID=F6TEN3_CIOIN